VPWLSDSSEMTMINSRGTARKNNFRKVSAILAIICGSMDVVLLNYLFGALLSLSALLMIVGGIIVWRRSAITGALVVLLSLFFGGFLIFPVSLSLIVGFPFDFPFENWAYGLPLGLILPIASIIFAVIGREPSRAEPLQLHSD